MKADPVILALSGDLDLASRAELADRVAQLREAPYIVIDLSGVTYLDSLTVTALMKAHANTSRLGGSIAVVSSHEGVVRILTIAGVTRVARVFDTVGLARDHLIALAG